MTPRLSEPEEFANVFTHGMGAVLTLVATFFVFMQQGFDGSVRAWGFLLYVSSLVFLFVMSALSHLAREESHRDRMRAWDQGAIYLLIAGTYTPGLIAFVEPMWAKVAALLFVWGVAVFGFYRKVFIHSKVNSITTVTYLLLGWGPSLATGWMVPREYFWWILAGGIAYSIGVVFLLRDRKVRFFHAVWHVWVMIAAGIHFYAIYSMAI